MFARRREEIMGHAMAERSGIGEQFEGVLGTRHEGFTGRDTVVQVTSSKIRKEERSLSRS